MDDPLSTEEEYSLSVIHFAEGEDPQIITPDAECAAMRDGAKSAGETVSFDTGSLSVYAIVAYQVTTNLDGNSFFIVISSLIDSAVYCSLYLYTLATRFPEIGFAT